MSDLTRAEAIKEITEHLNHWKRLLKESICGKEYGERTIKSFELAIDSLKTDSKIKEAYDKGYKDGQDALAYHLELCKEEQELCEDCISRQGAIDALEYNIRITSDEGLDEYRTVLKEMLVKIYDTQVAQIKALPPVAPKPNTDVLDKIKSEIKEVQTYKMFEGEDTVYVERKDVLAIIDKCKAEKE